MVKPICFCCRTPREKFSTDDLIMQFADGSFICENCTFVICDKFKSIRSTGPQNVKSVINSVDLTASAIKSRLDEYVIGQDDAKRALCITISQHLMRIKTGVDYKNNLLIAGPSGSGKTEMYRALCTLGLPMIEFNCSALSPSGYIGDSVSSMIDRLYMNSNKDVEATQKGIIFLDEFDKLAHGEGEKNEFKHKSIQQEFLKIIEGTDVVIKSMNAPDVLINTKNILFIAAGAFVGLNKKAESKPQNVISLSNQATIETKTVSEEEYSDKLIEFGLMTELVGRFPIVTEVHKLSPQDYFNILLISKNSPIVQVKELLKSQNVDIDFDVQLITKWSQLAQKLKTGARGLKSLVDNAVSDIFMDIKTYHGAKLLVVVDGDKTKITEVKHELLLLGAA
jgi:ATP-dependent Clp protease ATP-binding subunit ClpX